jgi:hypothetical protein
MKTMHCYVEVMSDIDKVIHIVHKYIADLEMQESIDWLEDNTEFMVSNDCVIPDDTEFMTKDESKPSKNNSMLIPDDTEFVNISTIISDDTEFMTKDPADNQISILKARLCQRKRNRLQAETLSQENRALQETIEKMKAELMTLNIERMERAPSKWDSTRKGFEALKST